MTAVKKAQENFGKQILLIPKLLNATNLGIEYRQHNVQYDLF